MNKRLFVKTAMAAVLAMASVPGHALGLGELSIASNLNQRFTGSIPLSEISAEDLETVTVSLAPAEAYERAGIDRSDFLNSLRFAVQKDGRQARVMVSSTQIAREPVVNVLVQARWKGGKIVREYAVLLDPPDLPLPRIQPPAPARAVALQPPVPVAVAQPAARLPLPEPKPIAAAPLVAVAKPLPVPPTVPAVKVESEFFEPQQAARTPAPRGSEISDASENDAAAIYGPIKPQETLWRVATNVRPSKQVSMDQVMLALVQANPVTIQRGITLSTGTRLNVPSVADMLAASPTAAKQRLRAIQAGRASATAPVPAAALPRSSTEPVSPSLPVSASASGPVTAVTAPKVIVPSAPVTSASLTPPATPVTAELAAPAAEPSVAKPVSDGTAKSLPEAADKTPAVTGAVVVPPAAPDAPFPAAEDDAQTPSALGTYWPLLAGATAVGLLVFLGFRRQRKNATGSRRRSTPVVVAPPQTRAGPVSPTPGSRAGDTQVTTARALATDTTPLPVPAYASPAPADNFVPAPTDFDLTQGASVSHEAREAFEHVPAQAPAVAKASNDPLADADFHLSYGLYDEAEEVLTQALLRAPQRKDLKLKLAETYFASSKAAPFVKLAEGLKDQANANEWATLAIMGSQLVPGSVLFAGKDAAVEVTDFELTMDRLPAAAPSVGAVSMDFADTVPPPFSMASMPNLAKDLVDDVFKEVAAAAPLKTLEMPTAFDQPADDAGSIDFMLGQSIVPLGSNLLATPSASPRDLSTPLEFNLGGTALNMNSPIRPLRMDGSEVAGMSSTDFDISLQSLQVSLTPRELAPASDDELNTKLDLARAYLEMDDHDSARGLLKEVQEHGNEQHQKEAASLLLRMSS